MEEADVYLIYANANTGIEIPNIYFPKTKNAVNSTTSAVMHPT